MAMQREKTGLRKSLRPGALLLIVAAAAAIAAFANMGSGTSGASPLVALVWHTIERENVSTTGGDPNNASGIDSNGTPVYSSASADGRFVTFESRATNLVTPATTTNQSNVFVRDRQAGTTVLADVDGSGNQANSGSEYPYISANGQWVTFFSGATNLVTPAPTNGAANVYVHNLQSPFQTVLIYASVQASQFSGLSKISADGKLVYFESCDGTIMCGGCGVVVHDRDVDDSGTFDTPGNTSDSVIPSLCKACYAGPAQSRTTSTSVPMAATWHLKTIA